ncbi:MAG TPA: hypothetical protein GXZ78_03895 [Eubacteriaceae bacterium]|nr:hypothetical protein [Eubacteriaceae bacterium]
MNEEYVNTLKDIILTFLSFSDKWLEDEVIDSETYTIITNYKSRFIEELE